MTEYQDRQNWDLNAWPEMYAKLKELQLMIFLSEPGLQLNMMTFTISSVASGCRHCQAHGAFGLDKAGVSLEKIQALWTFEASDLFSDRERAALGLGLAAGVTPSAVSPAHHQALRDHFSDAEARTLISVTALGGFMNRYNDTLATVTDAESRDWAETHLSGIGWSIDKHIGHDHEQRAGVPDPTAAPSANA
ncbi:MAG: alkylhydroperoxidase family enzyme [Myxococcota bacterium]|jgi:alkylhydroperoxidase family enzyme